MDAKYTRKDFKKLINYVGVPPTYAPSMGQSLVLLIQGFLVGTLYKVGCDCSKFKEFIYRESFLNFLSQGVAISYHAKLKEMLFEKDLEDMPLYINDEEVSFIARWRMDVNK